MVFALLTPPGAQKPAETQCYLAILRLQAARRAARVRSETHDGRRDCGRHTAVRTPHCAPCAQSLCGPV